MFTFRQMVYPISITFDGVQIKAKDHIRQHFRQTNNQQYLQQKAIVNKLVRSRQMETNPFLAEQ